MDQENRIIKWCETGGSEVRYASANLRIHGFEPCGSVKTAVTCDPLGAKFIGPDNGPHGYKNCAYGKRLQITNIDDTQTPAAVKSESGKGDPLSSREQQQLRRDLQKLEKENVSFDSINLTNRQDIEKMINLLDPQEKKMIEQLFGKDIKSILKQAPF